jgi:hypothetical protein
MSVIEAEDVACPACGGTISAPAIYSVNGGRSPDLRDAILTDQMGRLTCPHCAAAFRVEPRLCYVDVERGEWMLVEPVGELPQWTELEAAAQALFDRSYGPQAAPAAQAIGRELRPRITFGWAALREKLVCARVGVDDIDLEMVKVLLLRSGDDSPIDDDVELRLLDATAATLSLAWLQSQDGDVLETLEAPRALLGQVRQPDLAPLRAALSLGTFVDLHRILVA